MLGQLQQLVGRQPDDNCSIRNFNHVVTGSNKRKKADFPDALIVNKAAFVANKLNDTLDGVYTFDLALQTIPGTKKP